jgi:Nucleoside-diphosphate-sugar pyrophosphorylase involved in lipopolysaccharide biosynthesis/translation initiation factor 2B, gamma/epsilon subunits (eIF-2Bgamma/eIF-2Bepsilon)
MKNYSKYLIKENQSVLNALKKLNDFEKDDALTLFVLDDKDCMLGTLTDGDIRRSLVAGLRLEEAISSIMHRNFHYLDDRKISVQCIHSFKEKGVILVPVLDSNRKIVDVINLKSQKSYLPIDAVLMAGGKGERLRPLTEKIPKPLLKVGSKAIIDYNIDSLLSYGVRHISVTVNYLHEQIEEHFAINRNGVMISCVHEPKYLGTIGSVRLVDNFYNDTVLLMNSDLFTNINYEDFYLHFKDHKADMSVAAIPYSISVPYGILELDGRDIKGVREKPTYNYYANAGIYLIKKKLLNRIPQGVFFNATDFMEMLIHEKLKVIRFPITGYWIDIGKREELERASEMAKHIL